MTDTAMEIWREADRAGEDAYIEAVQTGTTADLAHKAGEQAAAAVIARHIPQGGDGLVAELERQQGLAKAYRRAQLTAEEKLCREQANSAGWKKRSEYQATRITQLKTQCERMAEALGVIAPLLDYLPHPHCITAIEAARQALEKDAS